MGNPSDHVETPLTGGYLLIILAEPRNAEHKLAILKRLTKGLSCWNFEESGVEIATELNAIVNQNIEGEEGKNGEQLFQYASDNLVAEILVNPQHSTLVQCVRNLLASFTKYRCIIYAGYSFTENGSWILQDGAFSVADFLDAYKSAEAQRTVRLHENQIRIELHCATDADWIQASRVKGTRFVLNPSEKLIENESIENIVRWLCDKIEVIELDVLLEGSQVVGNIRFSRPTLYVFPAGQGDSALFGINGFNMLIDGGAGRNSCFWGFARHLDRLDAVLQTRLNSTNLEGIASFLKRKTMSSLYPQIGHFFCNFKTRKQVPSPNINVQQDVLSISLIDTAQNLISDLKQLQLRPHLCYRNINLEPINLYHKVGHGKLDMYVLNPSKDSKEVKDFMTRWNEGDQKLFSSSKDLQFPLPNIISICTLLVWQPANPNTTITRILFPGSSPQNKLFEALERVKHLEFLKHPSCSIKSMSSSTTVTIKSQTIKKTVLEKMIPGETKTVKTMENLEVSHTASNSVIQTAIIPTVPKEGTPKPKSPVDTEKQKTSIKTVIKESTNTKIKNENKYGAITAKVNSNKVVQKASTLKKPLKLSSKSPPTDKSSPTTPTENQEKTSKPTKQVFKPKSTTAPTKSPSSTPTKSKKEEVNRKVLVSSRTNSGLRRNLTTKKDLKPSGVKNTEIDRAALKKDANVVYKSSLISGNKEKGGEEEDILIIEKLAISPETLLTPDGKKKISNELEGILTTAKDIVINEKRTEKLSDSGATTAPTMPEDEKLSESKKETDLKESSDKKVDEFKKAKDALKTPDEVADLPFHEEVDEQKSKTEEKEEVGDENKKIVHVEKAEYVLVPLDSSPEVLKRQVLETVDLLDGENDEDSDKEEEYENPINDNILPVIDDKEKLIEHLLESSKELCEITDKIDELKKKNNNNTAISESEKNNYEKEIEVEYKKNEITTVDKTELIESTKTISINEDSSKSLCPEGKEKEIDSLDQLNTTCKEQQNITEAVTDIQKHEMSSEENFEGDISLILPDNDVTKEKITSQSSSICTEQECLSATTKKNDQETKISSKVSSIYKDPIKSQEHEKIKVDEIVTTRSSSICQDKETIQVTATEQNQVPQISSKDGSVCEEQIKSPNHETHTTDEIITSRSNSICQEQESALTTTLEKQESKVSSKASSIYDEQIKSPVQDTKTADEFATTRSSSICQDKGTIQVTATEQNQVPQISSKDGSVCEEQIKSPNHETHTTDEIITSRSSSICQEQESSLATTLEIQESKVSSKASSVCDEQIKSPVQDTKTADEFATSRSSSICQDKETIQVTATEQNQMAQISSKDSSVCEEQTKSPNHGTHTTDKITTSRSSSISQEQEIAPATTLEKQESKVSSKASSICDEQIKSPVHDSKTADEFSTTRSSSICQIKETIQVTATEQNQVPQISSKNGSVCEEQIQSPNHETHTIDEIITSRSSSICQEQESALASTLEKQVSKASSKASSICDEQIKSPVQDTKTADEFATSRSSSICQDKETIQVTATEQNQMAQISSKDSSVCEEQTKSPNHGTHTTDKITTSRSSSISQEQEIAPATTLEKQESKVSSKASSICDEQIKSPVHDAKTADEFSTTRSSSICQIKETIQVTATEQNQVPQISSKNGSVCEEQIQSPNHETHTIDEIITSRSSSICQEQESALASTLEKQESKASSKASSICDEQIKSPVQDTKTADEFATSRSSSICQEQETVLVTAREKQESKVSSKASSICEEQIKSPVHETLTTDKITTDRPSSIYQEQDSILAATAEKQEPNVSSKSSSICEEPKKSPDYQSDTTEKTSKSRSNSVCQVQASTLTNSQDDQTSKVSSKANSISEENLKSPVHEKPTVDEISNSRSSSICQEKETIQVTHTEENQGLPISSKTSSVCEEQIKSPIQESHIIVETTTSTSSSICHEKETVLASTIEKQESKASSKAISICDEQIKSPVHDTKTPDEFNTRRSSSICQEQESVLLTTIEKQESNISSKASSICDEQIKSPDHEKPTEDDITTTKSSTIRQEQETMQVTTTNESQVSGISSKASSVCEYQNKSPVLEKHTADESTTRRSSSISHEQESILATTSEKQEPKMSNKASSLVDEHDQIKSPIHEKYITNEITTNRASSICQELVNPQVTTIEKEESKVSSRASSICDEQIRSLIYEKPTADEIATTEPSSICQEKETIQVTNTKENQVPQISSKANSVCEEQTKSPIQKTHSTDEVTTSRSSSICQEQESVLATTLEKQGSKVSSRSNSICDEQIKSLVHEKPTSNETATLRSSSICQEKENIQVTTTDENQVTQISSKASSVYEEEIKSPIQETHTKNEITTSRSSSICQEHEAELVTALEKQESKVSSKASSICEEQIKSPIHEIHTSDKITTDRSSSICQEQESVLMTTIEKQESKVSSKGSSICDEQIKSPVHDTKTTDEFATTRSSSICQEKETIQATSTEENQASKNSSKDGSVCEEQLNSPIKKTHSTDEVTTSRSSSICQEQENALVTTKEKHESKVSSRASSICDEQIKSLVHDKSTADEIATTRSSSIYQEKENIQGTTTEENQVTQISSKASSVCEEQIKSPIQEILTADEITTSRSNSICQEQESVLSASLEKQESKVSSRSSSTCDEKIKSLVHEKPTSNEISTSRSSSICQEKETIQEKTTEENQVTQISSKASSVCEEQIKSPHHETHTTDEMTKSRSNSIYQQQESAQVNTLEKQESKFSSKASSICEEQIISPVHDTKTTDEFTTSRSSSICQEQESLLVTKISTSQSNSICQEQTVIVNQESIISTISSFKCDEPLSNETPTTQNIDATQVSSNCQLQDNSPTAEIVTDDSKVFTESSVSVESKNYILEQSDISELKKSVDEESKLLYKSVTGKTESNISNNLNYNNQEQENTKADIEVKSLLNKNSSVLNESNNLPCQENKTIHTTYCDSDKKILDLTEVKTEESKSLGRIGSICEEITKFLSEDDKKISKNTKSDPLSECLSQNITLNSSTCIISETDKKPEKMISVISSVENKCDLSGIRALNENETKKSPQIDKLNQINDNIYEINKNDGLPITNITESNNKSQNISTLLNEENNKTGKMNVAQMVEKITDVKSPTEHTVIMVDESEYLKTVTSISNTLSDECLSKSTSVLIEDVVKTIDEKNLKFDDEDCNSTVTTMTTKQSLGVTLDNEDLGVTKDIVMQFKRDVHEALHQCSSDDDRPFTPQSEISLSRSTMNIDFDDEKNETDDDMPGSPMSTGPSPVPMRLDNSHVEMSMDFNKALEEHRITRGEDLTTTETNGNHVTEIKTTEHDNINQNQGTSSDTVQSWGKPLGLPPVQSINNNGFDPIREWGKPLGLPSPTQPNLELSEPKSLSSKTTPKKNVKKSVDNKPIINVVDKDAQNRIRRSESPSKLRSRSSSRMSRINPVYLDLIYVPHHGNSKYVSADFFKRIRARNYVFSGTDPSKEVLNALIEGKQAWEDQDLEVTIIPTYDTDTLGQWVAENEELLATLKIDLSPSASRCTIKLQDHNTSCSAYRLEF